jgi:hypothetical protein
MHHPDRGNTKFNRALPFMRNFLEAQQPTDRCPNILYLLGYN